MKTFRWLANNLPTVSRKWGRQVENAINELVTVVNKQAKDNAQALKALTINLNKITRSMRFIQDQQEAVASVASAIPITSVFSGSRSNYAISSGTTNMLTIDIVMPAEKTTASIFATGSAAVYFSGPQSNVPWWDITIDGNVGQPSVDSYWKMDSYASTAMHAHSVTAAEPGATVTVHLRSRAGGSQSATATNKAQLQVIAVFS